MANDIKQKIVLEGEKQYNQALSEAKRNLKTLRSELKAETAELGANATAQQKNETRMKSLQKQIREQEKIVKTYQEALKEVKEKYGENEEAIAKWEVKLNDARTSLANMKNELEGVGQGFQKIEDSASMATVASKSVADAFGQLGSIGDAVSGAIEGIFTGLLDTLKTTLTEIWTMISDTAARANNWTDLASYYGTTASQIEKMNYAVEAAQGNFSDFTNLLNQLSWGGKEKKITEWFNISDVNYENKLDYAMAVLEKMQDMQKTNPKGLENAMEDIFGAKKSQQILWFVSNLETIRNNMADFDQHGYGMGEESIKQMNDVWTELGKIEEKWDKLKDKFASGFGSVTLDIMANVNGGLDALMDYFNADNDEARNEALDRLEKNIVEAFERIAQAIEDGLKLLENVADRLKNSDNPTAKALGTVLGGLVDALQWITESNMTHVVTALEILAGFWLVGKGAAMAAKIAQMVSNIATIRGFSLLGGGGAAASGVGSGLGGGGGLFAGLFSGAGNAVNNALQWLANAGGAGGLPGVVGDMFLNQTNAGRALRDGGNVLDGAAQDLKEAAEAIKSNAETFQEDWENNVLVKALTDRNANADAASRLAQGADWRPSYMRGYGQDLAQEIAEDLNLDRTYTDQDKENAIQDWWDAWRESAEDEASSFDWMQEVFGDQFGAVWDNIIQRLDELGEKQMELEDLPSEWWKTQGGNAGNQDGMTSADARSMTDAVNRMPKAVAQGVSGIRVYMDGASVGRLVAPYVSQHIATAIG